MAGLRGLPGVLADDPAAGARIRAIEESGLAVYVPILDADPEQPGEGQLWIVNAGGTVTLRTKVDDVIKSVTMT